MQFTHRLKSFFNFPNHLLRLWLIGVGIGTALASYTLMSAVQFLYWYGPSELGRIFLEAGLLTWLVFAIYNYLHTYRPLAHVAQIFTWGIVVWFGWLSLQNFIHAKGLPSEWSYWAFLVNFPIFALYQTIFWSMSEKILNAQDLKMYRLVLNMGISFAQIIIWGLIAFVLSYPTVVKISYLLATAGAIITAGLYSYYPYILPDLQKLTINAQAIKVDNKLSLLLKQLYPNRLAWFVFLGALLAVQLDYLFWLVVDGKYQPHKLAELPKLVAFLGSFWAVSALASFLIKVGLYSALSKQYGVRTVLLAMPALLFFFLSILTVLGGRYPNSFLPTNAFIFTLLVLCEQIREVFNEAFQLPAYRMYLLPIDDDLRADTQIKLDGFIAGTPLVLFGILMGILLAYDYYAFWGQVVVALLGLIIWGYSIFRLQTAYKELLQNMLSKLQNTDKTSAGKLNFQPFSSSIIAKLHSVPAEELPIYLNVLRILNPLDYRKAIVKLIDSPDEKLQQLRDMFLKEVDQILTFLRQELQNTRSPDDLNEIIAQIYKHTRKLAGDRKKENRIADEKLVNVIYFVDERVFAEVERVNHTPNANEDLVAIAEKIAVKIDEKIVKAGELFYKNIQQENIEIKEKHQILALKEAEKNCSLEVIILLYILIHSKYFPILIHADLVKKTFDSLRGSEYRLLRLKYIEQLTLSKLTRERIAGAMLAGYAEESMKIRLLTQLLQDVDATVRYYAVLATSGAKTPDTYQVLVEKLGQPEYTNIAFAAFVSTGDSSLETLEQVFHFAGQKEVIQRNIIYIYSYIGSERSIELLLQKVTHSNLNLRIIALKMLSKLGIRFPPTYRRNINAEIEGTCQNLVWNMSATLSFKEHKASELIIKAMQQEMKDNRNQIFDLLTFIYDPSTVSAVRNNLQSGDADKEDFATELLDILIDETSKPLLIPLLTPNSLIEQLNAVKLIFPAERLPLQQTLHALLQRGFRQINSWTRACALEELAQLAIARGTFDTKDYEIFVANLVNPDAVLSELAADALRRTKGIDFGNEHAVLRQKKKYQEVNVVVKKVVHEVNSMGKAPILRFEIAKFLRTIPEFEKVSGVLLTRLASLIEPMQVPINTILNAYADWLDTDYFVIYSGVIKLTCENQVPKSFMEGEFLSALPLFFSENVKLTIEAETEVVLYKIPRIAFQELLLFEEDLVKSILDWRF